MRKIALLVLSLLSSFSLVNNPRPDSIEYPRLLSEWEVFTLALIQVESAGDSLAVGPTNDLGILQITPIYVYEANRICGENRYTLEDRTDRRKSMEMFRIVQGYYNPERNVDRAIRLHNPGAGKEYADKIYMEMKKIEKWKRNAEIAFMRSGPEILI